LDLIMSSDVRTATPLEHSPSALDTDESRALQVGPLSVLTREARCELASVGFLMLKPDAVAAHKIEAIFGYLASREIYPLDLFAIQPSLALLEELYKDSLALGAADALHVSWDLTRRLALAGPWLGALIGEPGRRPEFHVRLRALKGAAPPGHVYGPGTLRGDLEASNRSLNLVHTSDEPNSTIREYLIFRTMDDLRRALQRMLTLTGSELVGAFGPFGPLSSFSDKLDLDFLRIAVRLRQRVLQGASQRVGIRALRALEVRNTELEELVGSRDPACVRWHRYNEWARRHRRPPADVAVAESPDLGLFSDLYGGSGALGVQVEDPLSLIRDMGAEPTFWEELVVQSTLRHRRDLAGFFDGHCED
jgi:nucleoside diphosphate kinase